MLYLIGTGLYYLTDMSVRALDKLKTCKEVYLERYTNLNEISDIKKVETIIGNRIALVGREEVESDFIVSRARTSEVALLVPGDPLSATTHVSLLCECKKLGIKFEVIHASSIFSAIAEVGFSLYKFGATCSIPIYTANFKPESFFSVIEKNIKAGLHTLVLLEAKDRKNFVSLNSAIDILKAIESKRKSSRIDWDKVVCVSRLGGEQKSIYLANSAKENDFPPACIVIPGKLNQVEADNFKILLS